MFTKLYSKYIIQEEYPEALIKLDFDDRFIYVNTIAAEFIDRHPEDLIGKHIWTAFPDAVNQPVYEAYQKAIKNKQQVYLEAYNATDDRWLENHIYQTDIGTTIGFRDITERKRNELIQKDNERRYQLIFENNMDGVALLDENGKIYSVNHAACKMFDRTEDEMYDLGRDGLIDITEPRYATFAMERAEKGYAYGELTGIRKDGTKFLIDIKSTEFTDTKGEKLVSVVMHDKTEINEAKHTIKEQYYTLHSLIESISNPVFSLDTHYCYTCFNKAHAEGMKKIYGKEIELGGCILDYQTKEDAKLTKQNIDRVLGGERFVEERESGDELYARLSFEIVHNPVTDAAGKIIGISVEAIDITDRKFAERRLKESEQEFRLLAENAKDLIFHYEILPERRFTYVSPSSTFITGYSPEDHYADPDLILKILYPDSIAVFEQINEGKLDNVAGVTLRMIRKDGTSLWAEQHNTTIYNEEGEIIAIEGIARDITERKNAELQLQESEQRFRAMIEQAPLGIALIDSLTGHIYEVNARFATIAGRSIEEMVTIDWMKITHPDDVQEDLDKMALLNSGKIKGFHMEKRYVHPDGKLVWINMTIVPIKKAAYKSPRHLCMIEDITDRRQADEAIRASEERYKSILIASPDGIAITDLEGRVLMTSPVTAKMFGFEKEEWLEGQLITDYIVPEDRPLAAHNIELMFKGIMTGLGEYRALRKDGSVFNMEANAEFIRDLSGAASQIVFIVRDISPRKKVEQQLKENQHFISEAQRISKLGSFKLNVLTQEWYFSSELNKFFGMKPNDAHTLQAWQKMIHPEYQDLVTEYYLTVVAQKRRFHKEYKIINPTTHKEHWVSQIGDLKFDEGGKPIEMIGTIQDITKRKEAEVSMQDALNRYDILSNASSDTIWDWDIKTDTIIYNQGIINTFGYTDLRVQHAKDWWFTKVAPDDNQRVMELVKNTLFKKQKTLHSEYRFLCANGKYKYVSDRSFVMYDQEGAPERMIGSMQDITNEKEFAIRIEKEVIEAQEREWNQIGMELHDNVNQLLAASILMMGLAKVKMEQGLDASSIFAESEKHVGEAITEIRKLSHQLAPVSVYNLSLQQVFESLIKTINVNKQYAVTLEMSEFKEVTIPYKLQVNLYRIFQAQLNNIIKYAKATAIIVSLKKSDHNIVFRIADNGIGFDPEKHHNGIGLENIRRRAKVFAGAYILNTAPGKGCEVLVKIPLYMMEQE